MHAGAVVSRSVKKMLLLRFLMVIGALCGTHGRTVELNWTVHGVQAYDLR